MQTPASIWNHLVHKIKTAHGTSVSSYSALPGDFHAGAGEGSCLASLIWNNLSSQIISISKEVPYRVTLYHAQTHESIKSQSEAYVDDTSFMINSQNLDPEDLNIQVNTLAQRLIKISQRAEEHCLPQEEPWNFPIVVGIL